MSSRKSIVRCPAKVGNHSYRECVVSVRDACISYNTTGLHATLWSNSPTAWEEGPHIEGSFIEEVRHLSHDARLATWSQRVVAFAHHPENIGHTLIDGLLPFFDYLQNVEQNAIIYVAPRASRLGYQGALLQGRTFKGTDVWTKSILDAIIAHQCEKHEKRLPINQVGEMTCGRQVDILRYGCQYVVSSQQTSSFIASNRIPQFRKAVSSYLLEVLNINLSERWLEANSVLFYSRKDSGRRQIENELEVFRALSSGAAASRQLGSVINLKLANLSFEEQALRFASAKVLVCPFGAHTANAIFMRPGSVIIELYPGCGIDGAYTEVNVSKDYELVPVEMRYLWDVMTDFRKFYLALDIEYVIAATCTSKRPPSLWGRSNLHPPRKAVGRQIRKERDMFAFSVQYGQLRNLARLLHSI